MIRKSPTCVLNMPMNEGQGHPHDSSGYGNNGTNDGADWVSGNHGWSLDFDGSTDNVNCGDGASLNFVDSIGIWSWIKTNVVPEDNNQIVIDKRLNGAGTGYFLYLRGVDDTIQFQASSSQLVTWAMPVGLKDNWHHLAGTFDGLQIKLYYDGDLKNTTDWVGSVGQNAGDLVIGEKMGGGLNFSGGISAPRIYNRAPSATEILNYFNAVKARYGL